MGDDRRREDGPFVAAFEHRNDLPPAMFLRQFAQPAGHVGVGRLRQVEAGDAVSVMPVETGGDHDQVGPEPVDLRDDLPLESLHERIVRVVGPEGDVPGKQKVGCSWMLQK